MSPTADNVTVDNVALTDYVVATDDDGTAQHQYVKLEYGADGTFTKVATGANALPIQDGGNSITVDNGGTFAAQATVAAGATNIAKAEDVASADADVGVPAMAVRKATPANTSGTDGDYEMLQMAAGRLWVDASGPTLTVGSHAVTNAGTFAVQAASAGDVAHDGVDSGNPVKVGARAIAHGTNPTAVAAADRTDLLANRAGIQWTIGGHPNAKSATYITTAAGTDDNVMAAIAGGTKYAVTRITITLDEATTVGVGVRLGFGTANVPALGASQADSVDDILVYHPGMVPGGGITIGDGSGVLGVGGDGAELRITNEVPTSGTLAVTITYFTIES